jgi:prepilin-type N-terminal cleavage/methylation domain-containing protein
MMIKKYHIHGFTLIEILICIAIMATMIIGVGNAYFHIFRNQAEIRQELEIQESFNLALESLALDAARSGKAFCNVPDTVLFSNFQGKINPDMIIYKIESKKLLRISHKGESKNIQEIASDVKTFSTKIEDNLLKIHIVIEKKKFNKIFSADYKAGFAVEEGA